MRKAIFKVGTAVLVLVLISTAALAEEVTKNLKHEFDINDKSSLVLSNRYGKIDIQNWTEQKVLIEVEVSIKGISREKAERLLEYIDVEFSIDGNTVKAITRIDERFNKAKGGNWNNGKEYSIDYTVKMPRDLDIDLSMKYGDVFIDELTGHSRLNIKYGGLQANAIIRDNTKPLSSLVLGYGKANITELDWLKMQVKYSKLDIENARALMIMSKYSKFRLNNVSSVVAESKYDSYDIGEIKNLIIETAYSGIDIDHLSGKLKLETDYTGTKVKSIDAGFKSIEIDNAYGSIELGIDPAASYKLMGEAKYASIKYPESSRMSRIEKSSLSSYEGVVGNEGNPASSVKIYTKYGSVKLNY